MSLIGSECKRSDAFSLWVLIGRGLFLLFHWSVLSSVLLFIQFSKSVFMAQRSHPFPFRTRKLSSDTKKILGWRRPGKLFQCRHTFRSYCFNSSFFIVEVIINENKGYRFFETQLDFTDFLCLFCSFCFLSYICRWWLFVVCYWQITLNVI